MGLLTTSGADKLALKISIGQTLNLATFQVGDASGTPYTPNGSETALVNARYSGSITSKTVNGNTVTLQCVLPAEVGGWYIRELGIYDSDGVLIGIAAIPERYKPSLSGDISAIISINVSFTVSNAGSVTLVADNTVYATVESLNSQKTLLEGEIASAVPSGAVMPFAMATAPTGWLECAGQTVSRTTYAALFAAIGTLYGLGDGSTTFKLPDLRGEFVRGWDHSRGVDTGRTLGSAQPGTLMNNYSHENPGGPGLDGLTNITYSIRNTSWFESPTQIGTIRPRNIAMMYCIKI